MPLIIKPIQIPILLVLGITLLAQSDARASKTQKRSVGGQQHHRVSGEKLVADEQHPRFPPALSRIDSFSRRVYMELGKSDWNATATANEFSEEFDRLSSRTGGGAGEALSALVELRMLDLQMSIRRARLMRDVVGILVGNCALCIPK